MKNEYEPLARAEFGECSDELRIFSCYSCATELAIRNFVSSVPLCDVCGATRCAAICDAEGIPIPWLSPLGQRLWSQIAEDSE